MPSYISKGGNWTLKIEKETPQETVVSMKTKEVKETITYNELDITKDGKVDEKDASLAGKVLSSVKDKISKPKKQSKKKAD